MICNTNIIKFIREENGSTTGEIIYIDENGGRWVKTHMTKENCGTGDRIGYLRGHEIYE